MSDTAIGTSTSAHEDLLVIAEMAAVSLDVQRKVQTAWDMGVPHGPHKEPWHLEAVRATMPIRAETMPPQYLEMLGRGAKATSNLMRAQRVEGRISDDWELMAQYWANLATAIAEYFAETAIDHTLELVDSNSPVVVRYDKLAATLHPDGVTQLAAAYEAVEAYCRRKAYGLTDEEIAWLQAFARAERALDVGFRHGYSERDFYRAQQRLWDKLGVDGRNEALVLAAEAGWVS